VTRVSRWHIFKPKIPILEYFGGSCNGILDVHLVYFTATWYILLPFGTFYGYFVYFYRFDMLHEEISGNPACDVFNVEKTL
jgi:hypothetical protein